MKTRMRFMDWLVLANMSLVLVFSIGICIIGKTSLPWLRDHYALMGCFATITCVVLAWWMSFGGSESPLWSWMPPFCLFPKVIWIRWLVVGGMIFGTMIGMVEIYRVFTS